MTVFKVTGSDSHLPAKGHGTYLYYNKKHRGGSIRATLLANTLRGHYTDQCPNCHRTVVSMMVKGHIIDLSTASDVILIFNTHLYSFICAFNVLL